MTVAASSLLFAVVFTLFVVAAVALLVLTLRFTIEQAGAPGRPGSPAAGSAEAESGATGTGGDGTTPRRSPREA